MFIGEQLREETELYSNNTWDCPVKQVACCSHGAILNWIYFPITFNDAIARR